MKYNIFLLPIATIFLFWLITFPLKAEENNPKDENWSFNEYNTWIITEDAPQEGCTLYQFFNEKWMDLNGGVVICDHRRKD